MHYFIKCLKQFTNFKGRARRREYWIFYLFTFSISFSFTVLGLALKEPNLNKIGVTITCIFLLPTISAAVRRMHDVGKSGWYLLVPIYNLILACTDSEKGPNKYGEDPKQDTRDIEDGIAYRG